MRITNDIILFWKLEYTKWPNHIDITGDDHAILKIKNKTYGVEKINNKSIEFINKKKFLFFEDENLENILLMGNV